MVTKEEIKKAVMAVISELFPFLLKGDGSNHLVILPKTPLSTGDQLAYVKRHYENEFVKYAGYKESERYYGDITLTLDFDLATEERSLCSNASLFKSVTLVSPCASMLRALAAVDESIPEVSLAVYALTHKKKVRIVTDFDFTDIAPGAFGKQICDLYAAASDMGCEIVRMTTEAEEGFDVMAGLVSEESVRLAAKQRKREIVIGKKTVVTPLAKDAAEELGIKIRIK